MEKDSFFVKKANGQLTWINFDMVCNVCFSSEEKKEKYAVVHYSNGKEDLFTDDAAEKILRHLDKNQIYYPFPKEPGSSLH